METGDASFEEEALMGAKKILIHATTRYPIVSAYEFEFLIKEDVIRERLKGCTLYLILQRPLTYMTNLRESHDGIHFDIVDDQQPPLRCHLPLIENKIATPDELMKLDVLFLKKTPDTQSPFNDVAGFKLWRQDGSFVVWYSPHKFLYEVITGSLHANIKGDPRRFLDFRVHYIGQAISQRVWKRLTGHHKLQKVLTIEGPVSEKRNNRVAWEVSLVMLSIEDFEEANILPVLDGMDLGEGKPILHKLQTEDDYERLLKVAITRTAPELTNEVEAKLIKMFKPQYNSVHYKNYPNIAKGTRSAGYTASELLIANLPVTLYSDSYRIESNRV